MRDYDYIKIRNEVRKKVEETCHSRNNKFKSSVWQYHIIPVVNHSLKLGKKFKADLEVLELAALLHDYAGLKNKNFYKNHHLHSVRLADKILTNFSFPKSKIAQVKQCINSHRGSVRIKPKTLEAKIIASADAMAHITNLADMFYLSFGVHQYETKKGAVWLKNKLQRSWSKIMPEGRKMIKEDYRIAMKILNKAEKACSSDVPQSESWSADSSFAGH